MALITIAEVKTLAFTRIVDSIQFKDSDIEMAEFKHIRPVLTENLYNAVVADTVKYAALVAYVKPCLAYFVKYLTFESFYSEISDRGINHLTGQNINTVSNAARTDLKNEVLEKAKILQEKMLDYVNQQYFTGNADYALFGNQTNVFPEKQFVGGFLVDDIENDINYYKNIRRLL